MLQRRLSEQVAHPAPYSLHPAPCTLHPAPCTLHPAPCTLAGGRAQTLGACRKGVGVDSVRGIVWRGPSCLDHG